jgi:hypothetical protein
MSDSHFSEILPVRILVQTDSLQVCSGEEQIFIAHQGRPTMSTFKKRKMTSFEKINLWLSAASLAVAIAMFVQALL